jgi:hypothetical protein
MKDFKISGSTCHNIMGVKGLGEKGKSYCEQWLKEQFFKRRYEFQSKYVTHGKENEAEALEMVKEYLTIDFKESDTQIFEENDLMRGTCDVLTNDFIIDVKCSWDCFTFPKYDKEIPKIDYYWQAQVYMELFNKQNYLLIYCLTDMHVSLIEKECRTFARLNNLDFETNQEELFDKFYKKYTYSGFELKDKIKVFEIKRNDSDIQKIKDRVIECRNYIEILKN